MPEAQRVLLPLLADAALDELDVAVSSYNLENVHPSLRKLTAPTYKGTFLKAYTLLTEMTTRIGWDELLRIRSDVFVMEEVELDNHQIDHKQPNQ